MGDLVYIHSNFLRPCKLVKIPCFVSHVEVYWDLKMDSAIAKVFQ